MNLGKSSPSSITDKGVFLFTRTTQTKNNSYPTPLPIKAEDVFFATSANSVNSTLLSQKSYTEISIQFSMPITG